MEYYTGKSRKSLSGGDNRKSYLPETAGFQAAAAINYFHLIDGKSSGVFLAVYEVSEVKEICFYLAMVLSGALDFSQ